MTDGSPYFNRLTSISVKTQVAGGVIEVQNRRKSKWRRISRGKRSIYFPYENEEVGNQCLSPLTLW